MQVASEWGQAKAEASQAKAAGDKNKQKSIGMVIRSLKQEMKELGQQPPDTSLDMTQAAGQTVLQACCTVLTQE